MITTNTCNGARKTAELLEIEIRAMCIAKGMTEDQICMYLLDCFNHLRNVWIGAMDKEMSTHLADVMREDLDNIDPRLRLSTKFGVVLFALDKEFSLCCNYAKGDGEAFLAWTEQYHPGNFLLPVERSSGSRQDLTVEGAGAVYMNRTYYVDFLDECITANSNNILQKNLFIILTSSQMIAMSRVYAIFHVAICLPMWFLVGKAHKLADQDWSCRSPNRLLVIIDDKLKEIVEKPDNFLNHDFMMNIYQDLRDGMTAFDEYLAYMFEQKQSPTLDKEDKEIPLDLLVAKLFFPKKEENKETEALVKEMGQQAAKCWMKEFRDPKKATSDNFDGDRSWANTSEEDHHNLLGTMATNDLSEQPFGMLTYQVDRFNRVLFGNAAATAQARMNGDFDRAELGEGHVDGAFRKMTDKLKHSLLITALKYARETTIKESDALKKQRNFKLKKVATLKAK